MKAMVYHGNRDVRLRDVEEPQPGPGEAKLRIDYCGICATDIEEYIYGPAFISHDEPNPLTGRKIPITIGPRADRHGGRGRRGCEERPAGRPGGYQRRADLRLVLVVPSRRDWPVPLDDGGSASARTGDWPNTSCGRRRT